MPEDLVVKLKRACDDAFAKFPDYCNQSTRSVLCDMIDPHWPLELADPMIDRIVNAGWQRVTDSQAWSFANQGKVVIVGLKGGANGHVMVIYPGPMKPMGGFTCDGRDYPAFGGPFPLAMSTSVSKWCGTRSKGDKTIRDAWTAADWPKVQRWCQP